mmetsp:Transcript_1767/g.2431  ORF Transcript_1767/g.2431 Transcript_1767/m.2431 type:complete len:217 (-) Transcript_1767:212-862(-)
MSFASRVPDWAKHGQKKKSEIPEGYVLYGKKKQTYARPYRPHGTFKALEKKGVLHTAKDYKPVIAPPPKGMMPGYTGYIRGKQHLYGRSYGAVSRLSATTSTKEKLMNPSVPLGPQYEIPTLDATKFDKIRSAQNNAYPVPGYSARETKSELGMQPRRVMSSRRARQNLSELNRGAEIYTRFRQTINSNPVPGQTKYEQPRKVIPSNMAHLQYISK